MKQTSLTLIVLLVLAGAVKPQIAPSTSSSNSLASILGITLPPSFLLPGNSSQSGSPAVTNQTSQPAPSSSEAANTQSTTLKSSASPVTGIFGIPFPPASPSSSGASQTAIPSQSNLPASPTTVSANTQSTPSKSPSTLIFSFLGITIPSSPFSSGISQNGSSATMTQTNPSVPTSDVVTNAPSTSSSKSSASPVTTSPSSGASQTSSSAIPSQSNPPASPTPVSANTQSTPSKSPSTSVFSFLGITIPSSLFSPGISQNGSSETVNQTNTPSSTTTVATKTSSTSSKPSANPVTSIFGITLFPPASPSSGASQSSSSAIPSQSNPPASPTTVAANTQSTPSKSSSTSIFNMFGITIPSSLVSPGISQNGSSATMNQTNTPEPTTAVITNTPSTSSKLPANPIPSIFGITFPPASPSSDVSESSSSATPSQSNPPASPTTLAANTQSTPSKSPSTSIFNIFGITFPSTRLSSEISQSGSSATMNQTNPPVSPTTVATNTPSTSSKSSAKPVTSIFGIPFPTASPSSGVSQSSSSVISSQSNPPASPTTVPANTQSTPSKLSSTSIFNMFGMTLPSSLFSPGISQNSSSALNQTNPPASITIVPTNAPSTSSKSSAGSVTTSSPKTVSTTTAFDTKGLNVDGVQQQSLNSLLIRLNTNNQAMSQTNPTTSITTVPTNIPSTSSKSSAGSVETSSPKTVSTTTAFDTKGLNVNGLQQQSLNSLLDLLKKNYLKGKK